MTLQRVAGLWQGQQARGGVGEGVGGDVGVGVRVGESDARAWC